MSFQAGVVMPLERFQEMPAPPVIAVESDFPSENATKQDSGKAAAPGGLEVP